MIIYENETCSVEDDGMMTLNREVNRGDIILRIQQADGTTHTVRATGWAPSGAELTPRGIDTPHLLSALADGDYK
jgi:hypothetical protein